MSIKFVYRELVDSEGENQAVRSFLMLYGASGGTIEKMRAHLRLRGYPLWPEWVETSEGT